MFGERIKRGIVPYLFSKCSVTALTRLTGMTLVSVYYHMVCDDEVPHTKHLYAHKNTEQFRDDLDYVARQYNVVSLSDVLGHKKTGTPLPDRALLLTFDDGFREMHDVAAPILQRKGIPATFFICSGCIDNETLCYMHKASVIAEHLLRSRPAGAFAAAKEALRMQNVASEDIVSSVLSLGYAEREKIDCLARLLDIDLDEYRLKHRPYLSSDQIRNLLKAGFTVGAHSIDHPIYASLPLEEQVLQTVTSVQQIRERFSLSYGAFAFPSTDAGVKKRYFSDIEQNGLVDVCFGTGGMLRDDVTSLLHRCSLEKPVMPGERILAMEYARKLYRMATGKDTVRRKE
jgi:peptidoglycan/xylan/chitin deacetylase (PgdA/CDA1 family)